jgi:Ca-activated chloride channel homolog
MTGACSNAAGGASQWGRVGRRRMPCAVVLLVVTAIDPACAARDEKSEGTVEQRRDDARAPKAEAKSEEAKGGEAFVRPVLLEPSRGSTSAEAARTFKSYGVGPTIDTTEESTSRVDLDLDTASYTLARAAIRAGELPPEASVRVEEFLAAIAAASESPDAFTIEIDATASPQRTGYQLLRVAVRAPRGDAIPVDIVFAIDGTAPMTDRNDTAREVVLAAASKLGKEDRIGVVLVGAQSHELAALARADGRALTKALAQLDEFAAQTPAAELGLTATYRSFDSSRSAHLVALTTGVGAETPLFELVAREAVAGRRTSALGLGDAVYDDAALERIAHAGRGRYLFVDDPDEVARAIEHARAPVVAITPRLTVRFDPTAVTLYRLLGYESRTPEHAADGPGSEPSVLAAGDTSTVLYELKLADDAPQRWGEAELQFVSPSDGKAQTLLVPIEGLPRAGTDMMLATIAAGTAEKLRGSYWARRLAWSDLVALHRKLPGSVRKRADVAELGRLVDKLAKLDQRRDRFEARSPQARMDFDRLPVIQ